LCTNHCRKPENLAFVRQNNLHLWNNGKVTQVTKNGSPVIFNGIADWVYEEEIISGSPTTWFSPDGEYLAYLSFDDSNVPIHTVPLFLQKTSKSTSIYPREVNIRYPKPGFPNPTVSASIASISNPSEIHTIPLDIAFSKENIIVGEVAWVTDKHDSVIFRCFNRAQNHDKHLLFDVNSRTTKVVRERNSKDGWLDNTRSIKYVGKLPATAGENQEYYIDVSDQDGWNHVYLFNIRENKSRQLTSGEWEVSSVRGVNLANNTVYFMASESHPTEQHVFEVSMINRQQKRLVENTSSYWSASFSPNASYYILNYEGPQVPYQELYATNQKEQIRVVKDNIDVYNRLRTYQLPTHKYIDLPHPSGFNLSAKITYPPNFDPSEKYPVLLTPYGGPNSQEVKKRFTSAGPSSFISSNKELGYVVFTVDNRGTGHRGRAFRNEYYKRSGVVEPEDQIWAAQWLIKNHPWVDTDRIGIWGWSNGGYVSAKVIEVDTQNVFSFAIATAPTSDPRLYDSMYTERYLGLLPDNKEAYDRAAIRNVTNFKNIAGGVLFQHGTADDNVHFAHTAALVELLMSAKVPPTKLRSQFFPDSDHSIAFDNQQVFLFQQLSLFLQEQKVRKVAIREKHAWDRYDYLGREDDANNERTIGTMEWRQNVLMDGGSEEQMLGGSFYG
jgi:dipeptidyl-peptidase-4